MEIVTGMEPRVASAGKTNRNFAALEKRIAELEAQLNGSKVEKPKAVKKTEAAKAE